MILPDEKQYAAEAREYDVVPVYEWLPADLETPVTLFLKAGGSFLLESVEQGGSVGRYSIIGLGRRREYQLRGDRLLVRAGLEPGWSAPAAGNPLTETLAWFAGIRAPARDDLPPFWGGAIGFLGYEAVRYFEEVPVHEEDEDMPDGWLVVPQTLLVYDAVRRSVCLIDVTFPAEGAAEAYREACGRIAALRRQLEAAPPAPRPGPVAWPGPVTAQPSRELFLRSVDRAKRYIAAGDVFQVVLSRSFSAGISIPPFALYRSLRVLNPSPYLYYLDFGPFCLLGSSPEVMVRLREGELLLRPIAGTRRRGRNLQEDEALARELLADEKERAEHLMLVDLGRNDLGRISKPGTVEVSDFMRVERYSHVMHLVSTVKGELDPRHGLADVLAAVYPAGTLTGAPKIRAMEIIAELEGRRRGAYGGMIFYLGFNGNLDSCIAIRGILVRDGVARIQAGAGIVADSQAGREFEETEEKSRAMIEAMQRAHEGGRP